MLLFLRNFALKFFLITCIIKILPFYNFLIYKSKRWLFFLHTKIYNVFKSIFKNLEFLKRYKLCPLKKNQVYIKSVYGLVLNVLISYCLSIYLSMLFWTSLFLLFPSIDISLSTLLFFLFTLLFFFIPLYCWNDSVNASH